MNNIKLFFTALIILVTTFSLSAQHQPHSSQDSTQGDANAYMHNSSMESLIRQFESPERDEYQKPEKVLEYLGNIDGKTIMDIGAGTGYFSIKLAEKGANVIAADVNDRFQDLIKSRIKENKLKNIEVRKIPYDSPGLKDKEADMVFLVNTYHHIENRPEYFRAVKDGMKEGAELVTIDFFKADIPVGPSPDHKISMDVVITELKEAGYSSFEVNVELLPYQYIIKAK